MGQGQRPEPRTVCIYNDRMYRSIVLTYRYDSLGTRYQHEQWQTVFASRRDVSNATSWNTSSNC